MDAWAGKALKALEQPMDMECPSAAPSGSRSPQQETHLTACRAYALGGHRLDRP